MTALCMQLYEISQVLSENIKWTFPGSNPLSGTKSGIGEVVSIFCSFVKLVFNSI